MPTAYYRLPLGWDWLVRLCVVRGTLLHLGFWFAFGSGFCRWNVMPFVRMCRLALPAWNVAVACIPATILRLPWFVLHVDILPWRRRTCLAFLPRTLPTNTYAPAPRTWRFFYRLVRLLPFVGSTFPAARFHLPVYCRHQLPYLVYYYYLAVLYLPDSTVILAELSSSMVSVHHYYLVLYTPPFSTLPFSGVHFDYHHHHHHTCYHLPVLLFLPPPPLPHPTHHLHFLHFVSTTNSPPPLFLVSFLDFYLPTYHLHSF